MKQDNEFKIKILSIEWKKDNNSKYHGLSWTPYDGAIFLLELEGEYFKQVVTRRELEDAGILSDHDDYRQCVGKIFDLNAFVRVL